MADSIERLQEHRTLLFWAELAGLLHDTGKLQTRFLEYRRQWLHKHQSSDPHDGDFFSDTGDRLFKPAQFEKLLAILTGKLSELSGRDVFTGPAGKCVAADVSIAGLLRRHTAPGDCALAHFLKAADAKDASEDRNNPLVVNEQHEGTVTYGSSVFGLEAEIDEALFEQTRSRLYQDLEELLSGIDGRSPTFDDRMRLHRRIRQAFVHGLSDTTRPVNDIDLWEHSYATATLFKVLLADFILHGETGYGVDELGSLNRDLFKRKFSLWGVGWDALRYYGSGHKIGDVVGRKARIQKLKHEIREVVEWQLGIGNAIYDDDNGVYFIIPEVRSDDRAAWLDRAEESIRGCNRQVTLDELAVHFSTPHNTHLMVPIVKIMDEVRRRAAVPWTLPPGRAAGLAWVQKWQGATGQIICPVCRKRPMAPDRATCFDCERIRSQKRRHEIGDASLETRFHSEIVLGNRSGKGRLALLLSCFDLTGWLDGRMLYSQFIKESRSLTRALELLGKFESGDLKDDQERLNALSKYPQWKDVLLDHSKIQEVLSICEDPGTDVNLAKALVFLLGRHSASWEETRDSWQTIHDMVLEELARTGRSASLLNYLLTKNHSPSRLLRIWNGTRGFLQEQAAHLRSVCKSEGSRPRFRIVSQEPGEAPDNTVLSGFLHIPGDARKAVEAVKEEGHLFLISHSAAGFLDQVTWESALLRLNADEFGKAPVEYVLRVEPAPPDDIVRARTLTVSPDLFMAVIPADKAVGLANAFAKSYRKKLGKMFGRLPFGVGIIFFEEHMPMSVVLESAGRMLATFGKLTAEPKRGKILSQEPGPGCVELAFELEEEGWKRPVSVQLPTALGSGDEDRFHPYMIVEGDLAPPDRPSLFPTEVGEVVHFAELQPGDGIMLYPNLFDFEFLDSTTRRFALSTGEASKRQGGFKGRLIRPLLLEELEQYLCGIWKELKKDPAMTDSKLRNMLSLLEQWESWQVHGTEGAKTALSFTRATLAKETPALNQSYLADAAQQGLLFDSLELFLHVLKERIGG